MKIELKLMEKGKSDRPIGVILPPEKKPKEALVILDGDRDFVKEVERLIEISDKWDIR